MKTLIHEQNWEDGFGIWSPDLTLLKDAREPELILVEHPMAEYIVWFDGRCGLGVKGKNPLRNGTLEIRASVQMKGSQRNALSFNVRDKGGDMIFKYSFGGGGMIDANCQPVPGGGEDQPIETALPYELGVPYQLVSTHVIGSGDYSLSLANLTNGETVEDNVAYSTKTDRQPCWLDIDQEGGKGPAALGKVEIWLDR